MTITLDIWGLIAFAVGAWMLMDGLVFGLIPQFMRRMIGQISVAGEDELRQAGLICAAIGAVIVFLVVRVPGAG